MKVGKVRRYEEYESRSLSSAVGKDKRRKPATLNDVKLEVPVRRERLLQVVMMMIRKKSKNNVGGSDGIKCILKGSYELTI